MNQLKDILKAKREERKWNKSQMSRELKISSQLYGQYEKGDKLPGADFFIKWKKVFGQDLTSEIETKVSHESKNGAVVSNKPQHAPNSENQGLDPTTEVERLNAQQITIEAKIDVLFDVAVELLSATSGESGTLIRKKLEKRVDELKRFSGQ